MIDRKFPSKCPCAYNLNKCHFLTIVTEFIMTFIVFDIQEFLECRMLELILEMKLSLWNTCTYVFVHYKKNKICLKRKLSILPSPLHLYFLYLFHTYGNFAADSTNTRQVTMAQLASGTVFRFRYLFMKHLFLEILIIISFFYYLIHFVLLRPRPYKSMKCFWAWNIFNGIFFHWRVWKAVQFM